MAKHLRAPDPRTRRRARAAAVTGLIALSASASLLQAPAASAGVLPSTTTLSVSPATSYVGTSVTMSSTVSLLGLPGLGITPTGTVSFAYDAGATHIALGSNSLATCLLTTCSVSRTTSSLPAGTGTITATYSGDTFLAGSSATSPVTVNYLPEPPPAQSASNTCGAGQTCSTAPITVTQGANTDTLTVNAASSNGSDSVSAALTPGATLDCPLLPGDTASGQAMATVDNTANDAAKSVVYRVDGPAAVTIHNNYFNSSDTLVCFASPTPFNGYGPSGYGAAPLYTTPYGPYYEAYLGSCVNHSGYRPCFQLLDGSALPSPYVEVTVNTQPGDPKIIP
jgi:hypothetical protein